MLDESINNGVSASPIPLVRSAFCPRAKTVAGGVCYNNNRTAASPSRAVFPLCSIQNVLHTLPEGKPWKTAETVEQGPFCGFQRSKGPSVQSMFLDGCRWLVSPHVSRRYSTAKTDAEVNPLFNQGCNRIPDRSVLPLFVLSFWCSRSYDAVGFKLDEADCNISYHGYKRWGMILICPL